MCLLIWGAGTAVADPISLDDFVDADPAQARIGQLLFYDKILSGNRNISCGTCHHHDQAGGDGLSLGIGEGGIGVGPDRTAEDIRKRIPRNAPSLWNIGHNSIDLLFWDGRLEVSDQFENGFDSPAEEWLPAGLDNIVAAQSLFPLTAQFEMAGNPGENDIAGATHDRIDAAWPIIEARIRAEPEYVRLFIQDFDNVTETSDITIVEIGNAMGAFITTEWRSFDSPYDAWLTGTALPDSAERGRDLFFGTAGCASCHSGPLFSDQDFHALGLPAFGPGRTRSFDKMPRDVGRMGETDLLSDAYRFRTPSLRNVALTAPYGHNGAYPNLGDMIRHHLDPVGARAAWTNDMAALPVAPWMGGVDFAIQQDSREMARQQAVLDIVPVTMNAAQVADIEAFLHALTGNTAEKRPLGRPATVPSGLPID
jgi:cytochrome c peroxidase